MGRFVLRGSEGADENIRRSFTAEKKKKIPNLISDKAVPLTFHGDIY